MGAEGITVGRGVADKGGGGVVGRGVVDKGGAGVGVMAAGDGPAAGGGVNGGGGGGRSPPVEGEEITVSSGVALGSSGAGISPLWSRYRSRSSAATSEYRCSRSLASILRRMRQTPSERFGSNVRGSGRGSVRCIVMTIAADVPLKGGRPVSRW